MLPTKRTKTFEQCRAEAILLGMHYGINSHTYRPAENVEFICAETLKPLTRAEVWRRISENKDYVFNGRTPRNE